MSNQRSLPVFIKGSGVQRVRNEGLSVCVSVCVCVFVCCVCLSVSGVQRVRNEGM